MQTQTPSYPQARRILQAPIDGAKRKKVLASIAAYQDEGVSPSLRQIARRARLKNWKQAQALIKRLESDGLLAVEWHHHPEDRRVNEYEVQIDAL